MSVLADPIAPTIRPTRDGSHVQTVPHGSFGRIKKKRGARQLIFMPGLFFKIGRNGVEMSNIERECNSFQKAAKFRFWEPLLTRVYRIPTYGFVGRRLRPATPNDFDRLVETIETHFDASLEYPEGDMYGGVENRPLFQHLTDAERKTLETRLRRFRLPKTSMHGDVHVFNFVFSGQSPRLVDWEFFDPDGSFIYDYLEFFISVSSINSDELVAQNHAAHRHGPPGDRHSRATAGHLAACAPDLRSLLEGQHDPVAAWYLHPRQRRLLRRCHRRPPRHPPSRLTAPSRRHGKLAGRINDCPRHYNYTYRFPYAFRTTSISRKRP